MELGSTNSAFCSINVAGRLLKLYQKGSSVTLEESARLVHDLQWTSVASEKIIRDIIGKESFLSDLKYMLYKQLDEERLREFELELASSKLRDKFVKDIPIQKGDANLSSVFKRIQIANQEARYIALEVDLMEVEHSTPHELQERLLSMPLRKLFKILAKNNKSSIKNTRFTFFIKNIIILQELVTILLADILQALRKMKEDLITEQSVQNLQVTQDSSILSPCSKKSNKSSLSSCLQIYLERKDSVYSSVSGMDMVQRSGPIIPTDFNFTNRNSIAPTQNGDQQHRKSHRNHSRPVQFIGCCFNF